MNPRFESPAPQTLTPEQQRFYELFTTGPRAAPDAAFRLTDDRGALTGPPATWLLDPVLGHPLEQLGAAIRFGISLDFRAQEGVILTVAFSVDNPFELFAHVRAGRKAGWSDDDIESLRLGIDPAGATGGERAALAVTRRVLDAGTLSDAEYHAAVAELGDQGLFDVVTVIGFYRMVALHLAVFDIVPPTQ